MNFAPWESPYRPNGPFCPLYLNVVEIDAGAAVPLIERYHRDSCGKPLNIPMAQKAGNNPDCLALALSCGDYYLGFLYAQNARREDGNHLTLEALTMAPPADQRGLLDLFSAAAMLELSHRFHPESIQVAPNVAEIESIATYRHASDPVGFHSSSKEKWNLALREDAIECFKRLMENPIPLRSLHDGIPAGRNSPGHEVRTVRSNLLALPPRHSPARYKDIHKGKRGFILASGPSLNNCDLARLQDEVVISVNRSAMKYPNPDYTCSMAEHAFVTFGDLLREARILFTTSGRPFGIPMKTLGIRGFSFDLEEGVFTGQTISLVALQVAAYMGLNPIHFVGLDLKNEGDQTHFFGTDPLNLRHDQTEFPNMKAAFDTAMPLMRERGIEVTNCSPVCELKMIPHTPFTSLF